MTIPSQDTYTSEEFLANARGLILDMLRNQELLNHNAYSTEWFEKGKSREFHYLVAASQEIGEFINSFWLPWWSKAEQDMVNCKIEIVDALHFLLSQAIIDFDGDIELAADSIVNSLQDALHHYPWMDKGTLEFARMLQASINADLDEVFSDLFSLSYSIDFPLDKLYALYIGKSVLNQFRQDKGYRQGTYKKKWDGVHEDNHFMAEWIDAQEAAPTKEMIRAFLEVEYAKYSG